MSGLGRAHFRSLLGNGDGEWVGDVIRTCQLRLAGNVLEVRDRGAAVAQRFSCESVTGALAGMIPGFDRPFPDRPADATEPYLCHVETAGAAEVVVLHYPELLRTMHVQDFAFERATWTPDLPYTPYTLRFAPSVVLMLLLGGATTMFRCMFYTDPGPLGLASRLYVPNLQNVSSVCAAALTTQWLCLKYYFTPVAQERLGVRKHAQAVHRALAAEGWNWSSDRNEGESGFTRFREFTKDLRLKSFAAWQEASLRGDDVWANQPMIPVTTVRARIEELLGRGNALTSSMPHQIRRALPRALVQAGPLGEERSA